MDARNIDGSTPLCDACAAGSLDCVKLLLEYGATVNPPLFTFSPLHEACMGGVSCIVYCVLQALTTPSSSVFVLNNAEVINCINSKAAGGEVLHRNILHMTDMTHSSQKNPDSSLFHHLSQRWRFERQKKSRRKQSTVLYQHEMFAGLLIISSSFSRCDNKTKTQ